MDRVSSRPAGRGRTRDAQESAAFVVAGRDGAGVGERRVAGGWQLVACASGLHIVVSAYFYDSHHHRSDMAARTTNSPRSCFTPLETGATSGRLEGQITSYCRCCGSTELALVHHICFCRPDWRLRFPLHDDETCRRLSPCISAGPDRIVSHAHGQMGVVFGQLPDAGTVGG